MKLLFKQRFLSWFDSYDIYDENGNTVFTVEGKLSWGHRFVIYDRCHSPVGEVKQVVLTLMPKFLLEIKDGRSGCLQKEFALFKPSYNIDFMGWHISGDFFEWDYDIKDSTGNTVAVISKELFNWTDTYSIDVEDEKNALAALMVVIAIDAEKCSRNN